MAFFRQLASPMPPALRGGIIRFTLKRSDLQGCNGCVTYRLSVRRLLYFLIGILSAPCQDYKWYSAGGSSDEFVATNIVNVIYWVYR